MTAPTAALKLREKALAAGMRCRIDVGEAGSCVVRIQDDRFGEGFQAIYRNGKAHRAWRWPLEVPGVVRVPFRELGSILTQRKEMPERPGEPWELPGDLGRGPGDTGEAGKGSG